ncbi:MAG: hypothetical protein FJ352_00705 [Firmicutes bacterium]|nr:hypothetical protein [Bacillota bacterium]
MNKQPLSLEQKRQKQELQKQRLTFFLFNGILLLLVMAFSLWWQNQYDLKAFADGIWLVFAVQLTMTWGFFVYNRNIFTPLLHGGKTFLLLFVGKKPKDDYYTAYTKVQENQVPNYVIWISFLFTIFVIVAGVILTLEAYQGIL